MFDIHKVKPVHGWREFLGEVGIIVLGVLIALALEQSVEWFHWRHKVDQATEALHETVAVSSLPAIEQEVTSTCVDRQLMALEKHLLAAGVYQPLPLYVDGSKLPFVLRAPQRPWGNGTWRVITQEGVATHLDANLREQTDAIYAGFDILSGLSHENSQDLWKLNSLALPAFAERSERDSMVQVIEMIRGRNALMTISAAQLLGHVKEVGMLPTYAFVNKHVYHESGTIDYCRKLGLPLEPIYFRRIG